MRDKIRSYIKVLEKASDYYMTMGEEWLGLGILVLLVEFILCGALIVVLSITYGGKMLWLVPIIVSIKLLIQYELIEKIGEAR